MTLLTAKKIYDRLKEFGLTRAQVRKILPGWWSPEIETHPDGITELCLLISRRLNLDLNALMGGEIRDKYGVMAVAFKHRADATMLSLKPSASIATALAQAVIAAIPQDYVPLPISPTALAGQVKRSGEGIVGLSSLIDSCWSFGIPVIPIPNLPVGIRKMDGAVIRVGDRPAVIISKKKSSRAWISFIVAHEIGHIACGHLDKGKSIVDVSLQDQVTIAAESSLDNEEVEADAFALALLGGKTIDAVISDWPNWATPADLAVRAMDAAPALGVESGHMILRYAFMTKRWSDAMAALGFMPEDADAESLLKESLKRNINLDLIADDMTDLVCQITGIDNL